MVRMVKSQEDTFNTMAEEAGSVAFEGSIILIVSSDDAAQAKNGIQNLYSAYSVYTDEYGNEFEYPNFKADVFRFISKPIRKFAAKHLLTHLFFPSSVFTSGELASLFHFPARIYNRSNIIDWMPYKVLPAPDDLPIFTEENGYIMSGVIAEQYKDGKLPVILSEPEYKTHWAVGDTLSQEKKLIPIAQASIKEKKYGIIVEQDGQEYVQVTVQRHEKGFKLFKE